MGQCSQCENQARTRGLCNTHYMQDFRRTHAQEPSRRDCTVKECGRPNGGHGLCYAHQYRLKTRGALHKQVPVGELTRRSADAGLTWFTPRQIVMFDFYQQGLSTAQVARRLGVQESAVRKLFRRVLAKLSPEQRFQLEEIRPDYYARQLKRGEAVQRCRTCHRRPALEAAEHCDGCNRVVKTLERLSTQHPESFSAVVRVIKFGL